MGGISRFTPDEKAEIVLLCLRSPDKISEICREKGVAPVTYNKWKKKYICGGLDAMSKVGDVNGQDLKTRNEKLEATIGHLYVELITLKKKMEMER